MFQIYKKVYAVLDRHERQRAGLLLLVFLIRGITELAGVASIMPFMSVAANPDLINTNPYLASAYNYFGLTDPYEFLLLLGIAVFIIVVGSQLFAAFSEWFLHRFNEMCGYRLSVRLLGDYFRRPYAWFLSQHSADLGRTVVSEVKHMVSHAILPSARLISRVVVVTFLLLLVIATDPLIALSAAITLGGMYGVIYLGVRRRLQRLGNAVWRTNKERFRIAQEGLGGIKDIKVSGLELAYLERYKKPANEFARYHASHQIIGALPKYLLEAVAFGGIIAIVIFLLSVRADGLGSALPLIAVYAFAGYRLMPALQSIYHDLAKMKFGTRSLNRIHDELVASKGAGRYQHFSGEPRRDSHRVVPREQISLDGVSYRYPGSDSLTLDSIDLTIQANTTVAFVGTTGAGKTTIVDIILGLLEPDSGRLVVDDETITSANRRAWQRSIGYVPQQIFLADDTIAANIAFGLTETDIDMDAVEEAARIAELHDFVTRELPNGYQTRVGERGVRLSGGQRQRIGIARALYHTPDVLILDEATSALDNLTEQAVMSAVENLGSKKTIIMIAHRLSTVQRCDTIFLLEKGRIVDHGSFEALTERNDKFRDMAQGAQN